MTDEYTEKRKYERMASTGVFKLYTSVTRAAYTAQLKDVSKGGAFVKTKHIPKVDETITYAVLDSDNRDLVVGNARVAWCKERGLKEDRGFGMELEKKLAGDILTHLTQD